MGRARRFSPELFSHIDPGSLHEIFSERDCCSRHRAFAQAMDRAKGLDRNDNSCGRVDRVLRLLLFSIRMVKLILRAKDDEYE